MIEIAIYVLIGAFVGWQVPQPPWARAITAWVKALFSKAPAAQDDEA